MGSGGRWGASILLALAVHAAAAGLALGWHRLRALPLPEPPWAVMLEVADMAMAPPTILDNAPPASEISPLILSAEEPPAVVFVPAPHEVRLPNAELPPPVDLKPPPRPAARQQPQQPPAPRVTAPPPAPQPAPNVAAQQPGVSREQFQRALLTWQRQLLAHLDRHKRYPADAARMGHGGRTDVLIVMHRSGRVIAVHTERSSGVPSLDREGIERVWRAQPLPPLPPEIPGDTVEPIVPMEFGR
jgi:protein TonB